jgi:hypothetical protein
VDKRYLNAFLAPPKYVIGGIELDYFCPRHFLTLQVINSPFIDTNAKGVTGKDIFIALRICSTENWVASLKTPTLLERWRYLKIDSIPENKAKALEEFGRYLGESMSVPKIWIKNNGKEEVKKPTNIPETLSMVVILMSKFGFSEQEAWNMPFSKAVWYTTAYSSQEGAELSIITTEQEAKESEDLSKLEEFEKAMQAEIDKVNRKMRK